MTGTFFGRVVSNKMMKSVLVAVDHFVMLPKYHRVRKMTRKLMAHDEAGECGIGDIVKITSCRPISKNKAFKVSEILRKEKIYKVDTPSPAPSSGSSAP